jgi:hypothetical protein
MYSMPGFPTTGPVCTQLMVVACAVPVAIGSRTVATAIVMAASLFTELDVTGVLHGRQTSSHPAMGRGPSDFWSMRPRPGAGPYGPKTTPLPCRNYVPWPPAVSENPLSVPRWDKTTSRVAAPLVASKHRTATRDVNAASETRANGACPR